jgi:DNA-binding protein
MSEASNSKVVIIPPQDAALKVSDVTEKIISGIMDTGELDVVGIGDAIFLVCSALNFSCEIAKIYINQIGIERLEYPDVGRTAAVFVHLTQEQSVNYEQLVAEEEQALDSIGERTISVSRDVPVEKLLTRSLMSLAKFDEIKLIAAGGSITDAVLLATKLTSGQISKDPVGVKLIHIYSINMRNDPAKKISAISIYLQKGITPETTDFLKKIKSGQ